MLFQDLLWLVAAPSLVSLQGMIVMNKMVRKGRHLATRAYLQGFGSWVFVAGVELEDIIFW